MNVDSVERSKELLYIFSQSALVLEAKVRCALDKKLEGVGISLVEAVPTPGFHQNSGTRRRTVEDMGEHIC